MGMSASQVRLLQLTTRKNDIGLELSKLANEKVTLSRDMLRVSQEYQEALNQKTLKWSNSSGASYIDLTYQNLMKPSIMNQNTPYLLTDESGRVVIDKEYKKYAEMISQNGAPGDWESVRTQILSEVTGIDATKIDDYNKYQEEIYANEAVINQLIENEPKFPTKKGNVESFIKNLDSYPTSVSFSEGDTWSQAYSKSSTIALGGSSAALTALKSITDHIANTLGQYLDDPENLKSACETFYNDQAGIINDPTSEGNKKSLEASHTALSGDANNFKINVKIMLDTIMGSYGQKNGHTDSGGYGNQTQYTWNDIDSKTYSNEDKENWQKSYDMAKNDYDTAVSAKNQLFTADDLKLIAFYDAIFSSIAENGWIHNESVNDTDYLNQMLQNNTYRMTTVDRNYELDDDSGIYEWDNDYTTDIASNFSNIFTVNDTDAHNEALVEYEYEKAIINEKESRIDTRMKNLETEQAAVNQMIQSIEKVENDNIERTMNWSA